ncbi:MAG: segregation/condensation protein A [Deltaproteobacteria bacterium]|nr:segregation/condensation protein A [Deltaproteobacteria bacterium]
MSQAADSTDADGGRPSAGAGGGPSEIPDALTYRVVLPDFEGPLDLLLYLCKSHEIDILEIPISFVTQKYLEYLDLMQSLSVEVAAEYLVMAATLAYLKSRELVPQPEPLEAQGEEGDEVGDPKEELIRRLLEYQKYKNAAEQLGLRPIEGKNVFGRGLPVELAKGPEELAEHSPWKLIEFFAGLLQEKAPEHTHDVVIDRMSVAQRINQLIDKLESGDGSFRFDSIIDFTAPLEELRHQVVVTLLAVLELAKLKAIRVLQDPVSETFFVARASTTSDEVLRQARKAMTTSDGAAEQLSHAGDEAGASEAEAPRTEPNGAVVAEEAPAADTEGHGHGVVAEEAPAADTEGHGVEPGAVATEAFDGDTIANASASQALPVDDGAPETTSAHTEGNEDSDVEA